MGETLFQREEESTSAQLRAELAALRKARDADLEVRPQRSHRYRVESKLVVPQGYCTFFMNFTPDYTPCCTFISVLQHPNWLLHIYF